MIIRLNAEFTKALNMPEIQEKLKAQAIIAVPTTAEQFAGMLRDESARYGRVVKDPAIKLE